MKIFLKIILFLLAIPFISNAEYSTTTGNILWGVDNGEVYKVVEGADGTIYAAGYFDTVGQYIGGGVSVDTTTGNISVPILRSANDDVVAAVPDGFGGWYIGGQFTKIGEVTRNRLAHINADGEVDSEFDPNIGGTNSQITALFLDGTTLYAGGFFTTVNGGTTRNNFAAFDTTTGVATDFNPNINTYTNKILLDGTTLYVGGGFTTVNGGTVRNYLAALDTTTGLVTSFDAGIGAGSRVDDLILDGTTLYVAGYFTSVNNGTTRNRLAAFDTTTGIATDFNPNISTAFSAVYDLVLDGTTLYAGGSFTAVNGGTTRNRLAAFDTTTGIATDFNPNMNGEVKGLVLENGILFAAGDFTTVNGGTTKKSFAAVDTTTGIATSLDISLSQAGGVVSSDLDDTLYVTETKLMNPVDRPYFAALDPLTGEATDLTFEFNNEINTMLATGTTLYIGGYFTSIDGTTRNRLAAINLETGELADFDPNLNSGVQDLEMSADGTTIYVGGDFTTVNGGTTRKYIAELDAVTGVVTDFNPNLNNSAMSLHLDDGLLYAGGFFTTANASSTLVTRNRLAAFDAATGEATSWNPSVTDGNSGTFIWDILTTPTSVFVGGRFGKIGGDVRKFLAEVDKTTASSTAFAIATTTTSLNQVQEMTFGPDGVIYAGTSVSSGFDGVIGVDSVTGDIVFNPTYNYDHGSAVLATDDYLYVGGEVPQYLARFPLTTGGFDFFTQEITPDPDPEPAPEEDSSGGSSGSRRRCGEQYGLPSCTPTTTPSTATTTEPAQQDPANVTLEQLQTQLIELLKQLLQILLAQQH